MTYAADARQGLGLDGSPDSNLHHPNAAIYNQFMQDFPAIRLAIPTRVPAAFDQSVTIEHFFDDYFPRTSGAAASVCRALSGPSRITA
jgi:hypothetical protein